MKRVGNLMKCIKNENHNFKIFILVSEKLKHFGIMPHYLSFVGRCVCLKTPLRTLCRLTQHLEEWWIKTFFMAQSQRLRSIQRSRSEKNKILVNLMKCTENWKSKFKNVHTNFTKTLTFWYNTHSVFLWPSSP